jgi:AbrB family looped-hinge helix DNA binding protein
MSEATAKLDEKGRIRIPKRIRETAQLKEGGYVYIKTKEKTIILEPAESVADKYRGIVKVNKWPEDLDEFIEKVMQKWWTQSGT